MANTSSKLRQLNTLALTCLIVLGPFALYYLFYFSDQKNYFTKRDFRSLAILSKQIEMKVDNTGRAYRRAAENPVAPGDNTTARNHGPAPIAQGLTKQEIDRFLKPITEHGTALKAAADATIADQSTLPKGEGGNSVVSLNAKREDGASWLYFDYLGPGPQPLTAPSRNRTVAIQVKSTFENLIGTFTKNFINPKDFDDVIITQEDGEVIFQQGPAELNITNLGSLINKEQKSDNPDLGKLNSSVLEVRLAETDYKLFIQPIQLSLPATKSNSDQGVRWYVCGLVRSGHFLSESAAISYNILIVITFLLLFVALSTPFLKLLFMGSRERVRVTEVYFLFFSALMGSALLTVLLLYGINYHYLCAGMDDQLETLSDQIKDNFGAELVKANKELQTLTDKVLKKELEELRPTGAVVASGADQAGLKAQVKAVPLPPPAKLQSRDSQQTEDRKSKLFGGAGNNRGCSPTNRCLSSVNILGSKVGYDDYYPYLDSAVWIDHDGQQRIKWTTHASPAAFIPVKERLYFRNIIAERTWECCRPVDAEPAQKFYLEPIYSKTNGGQQVILSRPVPGSSSNQSTWVASLDFRALSLYQTVLPTELGYGYCVINNEGQVLFHSDESRNLLEDFFVETDNDGYLRSIVLAREHKPLTVRYQGVDHRLFVRPIPDTPWTLVTFRDKTLLRTVWLEVIAASIFLYILYATVLLVFLRFYYLRHWENRAALVWPNQDLAPNYCLSIVCNLLLALEFGLSLLAFNEWVVVILALVLPVLGFSFHLHNLRGGVKLGRYSAALVKFFSRRGSGNYRRGYILALATLFLLASALPMFAFFKFSHDREMRLYVGVGQINLARSLEDRAERVREQYAQSAKDKPAMKAFLQKRLRVGQNSTWDVYSRFFFNTNFEICHKNTDQLCANDFLNASSFQSALSSILPFNDAMTLRIHELVRSTSGDAQSVWQRQNLDSNGVLRLSANQKVGVDDDDKLLVVSSDTPLLGRNQSAIWWVGSFSILVLVALLLYGLIGFIGRRIFLLETDVPATRYGEELHEEDISQNSLVLASSFIRRDELLARKGFDVIDLRALKKKSWDGWCNGCRQGDMENKKIALNYFEYNHDNPRTNRDKLKLLEALVVHNRKVVVVSSIDPTDYRFEMNGGEQTNGNGVGENGSAAKLLSSFFRVYLEDNGSLPGFLDKLAEERRVRIEKAGSRAEKKRLERLFEVLQSECEVRAFLQSIGAGLLTKQDLDMLTPEDIFQHVQERANAYYHAIWETCSKDEKLTLCHLAKYYLVSSKNPDLPRLLKRGLIFKASRLRPMNESFSRFLVAEGSHEKLVAWQREGAGSSIWEMLRLPFFIILVGVAAFLFVSQRELYNSTLAFVSAFAAGMPSLLKFLGLFQSSRDGGVAGR